MPPTMKYRPQHAGLARLAAAVSEDDKAKVAMFNNMRDHLEPGYAESPGFLAHQQTVARTGRGVHTAARLLLTAEPEVIELEIPS